VLGAAIVAAAGITDGEGCTTLSIADGEEERECECAPMIGVECADELTAERTCVESGPAIAAVGASAVEAVVAGRRMYRERVCTSSPLRNGLTSTSSIPTERHLSYDHPKSS
jgi:hypothetical protein